MSYEFYVICFLLALVSGLGVVLTIDWIYDATQYMDSVDSNENGKK